MRNIKRVIGFLVFIVFIIITTKFSNRYGNEQTKRYYNELSFNGIISKKYIDNEQHNYPILEIKQSEKNIQEINLSTDKSGLFEYVHENDSIVKLKGRLLVHVFRNSADTIFILTWNNY